MEENQFEYTPEDRKKMTQELRVLARFCSLKVTRFVTLLLLAFHFGYALLHHYSLSSGYAILLLFILPAATTTLCRHAGLTGIPYYFPQLCRHYHFTTERFYGETISFSLFLILCAVWQRNKSLAFLPVAWMRYFPVLLVVVSFLCFVILYGIFRIVLHYRLSNNH